ncbi:MAG: LysM peptidoglycan-binding domain-containing protein, partial [Parachlamydiaceae bacterium]
MAESLKAIRRLTILLVLSGTLNIFLAGAIFYWSVKERPPTPYFELKPANVGEQQAPLAIEHTDSQVIRYFRRMPIAWLVSRLNNNQLVENGYTQRDLALASLVSFHHFDIERALAGLKPPEQKRLIRYGEFQDGTPAELILYPGLSEQHFNAIRLFAATERWPLTAKGLFLALQKEEKDNSLVEAFEITSEFNLVEMLFNRVGVLIDKNELVAFLLDGEWVQLAVFAQQQKTSQDFSAARRQSFLLGYVQKKSRNAARLMLKTDGAFAARKLDDAQVLQLLELIDRKSVEGEQFALLLLASPRSDAVRKLAAQRLYEYAGEPMPEKYSHAVALARFSPQYVEVAEALVTPPQPKSLTPAAIKPVVATPPPKPITPAVTKPVMATPPPKVKSVEPLQTKLQIPKQTTQKTVERKLGATTPPQTRTIFYVVKEGDSLWKIARNFNVDIEVIRAYNQLDSD